ncbi:MAG: HAD family phosphatase [Anaerolineales bacterium]|nr:HAD family phosphatase [Anaerolineales bacterium]
MIGERIEAVFFDVGGVLDRTERLQEEEADRRHLAAGLGLEVEEMWQRFYTTELWQLARIGKISDDEFWNRNLKPFGMDNAKDRQVFVKKLFAYKEVVPEMRSLLETLQGTVKLGIISNATNILEASLSNRYQIDGYFDLVINSARVGYAKPDPKIYQIALERMGVRPERTFFTDDQQHNVDAAIKLGINAVLFTGVSNLKKICRQLCVLDN